MKNNVLLEVENITKVFTLSNGSKFQSLNGVSFTLNKGESIGIIGANGSGKSTLLKIISGIIKPTTGVVKLYGSVASILDLGFGMIPELTGRENIYLSAKLDGLTNTYIENKIEDIIDFAEIGQYIDEPVKNYSNGMFLRLAFAIKTVIVPDILILDEVVAVGDISFQEKCKLKITELKAKGTVLIMASHSLNEVITLCAKSLILGEGNMLLCTNTLDAVSKYSHSYVGEKLLCYSYPENHESPEIFIKNFSVEKESNNNSSAIKYSEPFSLKFQLLKTENSPDCNVVVFVSDLTSTVLSDSFIYRQNATSPLTEKGTYEIEVKFPPYLFNQGTYFITIVVGLEDIPFITAEQCIQFNIVPDEWESEKIWNNNGDYFPFRMHLKWVLKSN